MNMKEVLLQWFMNFLIKHPQVINCIKTKKNARPAITW